jgi:hypothetical protein
MSDPTTTAQAVAFTIPLLPGNTDLDRSAMRSCWQGDRRTAYEASRKRLGITRASPGRPLGSSTHPMATSPSSTSKPTT